MLDPRTGFRCRSWYDGSDKVGFGAKIVAIDTPDPKTVVFRLDRPNSAFLDQMASLQCLTAILHPDSVARDGSWIAPIGTGPYRIAHWQRGEYVEIERFPGYHARREPADGYAGGRVALAERVRFMIVPEASVGQSALQAGDIDILPRVSPGLVPRISDVITTRIGCSGRDRTTGAGCDPAQMANRIPQSRTVNEMRRRRIMNRGHIRGSGRPGKAREQARGGRHPRP